MYMSVGVMKDYKVKLRKLRACWGKGFFFPSRQSPTLFVLWLLYSCHLLNRSTGGNDPSVEMQNLKDNSVWPWSRCWERWARLFVCLDPGLPRRSHCLSHLLLLKPNKRPEQFTSCTSVPNNYSQYSSTQCPIVYYTWFTVSTVTVKSVFWNTHVIHVYLNTPPFTDLLTCPSNRHPRHQSFP